MILKEKNKMLYNLKKRVLLHEKYVELKKFVKVQRALRTKYKCMKAPAVSKIKNMIQNFQKTGSIVPKSVTGKKRAVRTHDLIKINRKSAHRGSDKFAQKDRKYRSSFHRSYKISLPYRSQAQGIQKEPVVQTAQN